MSINVKIPACILPDIAQFIIYKKLMLRKKKMVSFANKLMIKYNTTAIGKQKMELKDAISIVYSATKMPWPDCMHPKQSEWHKSIKRKYPQFYSKNFIFNFCLYIYRILIEDDDFKSSPTVRDVLDGTWYAYDYILRDLYHISFSKEEKSILPFRRANKKTLAKATVDSLTFGIIIKITKEKQTKNDEYYHKD